MEALRPISKSKKKAERTWSTNHAGKKTADQVTPSEHRFHYRCPGRCYDPDLLTSRVARSWRRTKSVSGTMIFATDTPAVPQDRGGF